MTIISLNFTTAPVELSGEVTRHSIMQITKKSIKELFSPSSTTVDLAQVTRIDTAGLAWLFYLLEQANIDANLQAIAIKTGMDRRTISEHKNNVKKSLTNPMNKMDMVTTQLQLYSVKNNNKSINLDELQKTIDSIYAQHIRSKAIIKELLSNKIVIETKDGKFKLNFTLQQQMSEIRMMADEVDFTAKRLFQTYYKNMFDNNDQNIKLLQETCLSSKIPSSKHEEVSKLLRKELKKSSTRMKKIISDHESNLPNNTYPEIGVTLFQFNSTTKSTKNSSAF